MSQERYRTTIVPVLFRRCDHENLHLAPGNTQLVDLTGDFTKGCLELLKIWKLRFKP